MMRATSTGYGSRKQKEQRAGETKEGGRSRRKNTDWQDEE